MLKGQDLLVALHLAGKPEPTLAAIAAKLGMSYGEVHGAVGRLQHAQLLLPGSREIILPNLEEYVLHGARYSFPATIGENARGVPTGNLAAPLEGKLLGGELSFVWKHPRGQARGPSISPIYKDAPTAALNDPLVYRKLVLLDALRVGGARAREFASDLMVKELRGEQ